MSGPVGPSQYGGPSGPVPVPGGPGLGGMPSMRNGYYDRIDDRLDRVDRLDRMERDTYDRGYDSYYAAQTGPIPAVARYVGDSYSVYSFQNTHQIGNVVFPRCVFVD